MKDLNLPKYDHARTAIRNMKEKGLDWSYISNRYDQVKIILNDSVDENIWQGLVKEESSHYNYRKLIEKGNTDATIVSIVEDNECYVPTETRSSWQLYRQKLAEKGFREEAIKQIEDSTIKLLQKLSKDTKDSGPIKGLVIGQVQSGKTASMAGLMAMAADWGWNTFIILSGMIENLREQTQARLISDLNNPGNNNWIPLNKLSKNIEIGQRTQSLLFHEGSPTRFLNVCLKNKNRLENLIAWIKDDPNKLEQMKILIIDDEADHGSINTSKSDAIERTAINKLIIKLVNIKSKGKEPKGMNYISYTATPYSNFLNESASDSLYPKNFIGVLPTASEYFGPRQIFGGDEFDGKEEERLDIVRIISLEDKEKVIKMQKEISSTFPESLEKSICWFLISAAIFRYYEFNKPVSMLVHTSQKQLHHKNIANAIASWVKHTPNETIIKQCNELYNEETVRFDINNFRRFFSSYPTPNEALNDYPKFRKIEDHISELLEEITHIEMDKEGDLNYHKGIHLCIDNSSQTGINDENMHVRLAYPSSKKLQELNTSPAFIIVGGSTLSRGLTIEGLVSTFFLRAATAGDSLMQMGRWFGYRKGYELLPRIWMTNETLEKFQFLSTLEDELREELKEYAIGNRHPSEYGPRVKNTPKVSWLRITAKNKMKEAVEIDMDFTGASIQTTHFENDEFKLRNNINITKSFLKEKCGAPKRSKITNSLVFRDINFETIRDEFLLQMKFSDRSRVFNDIQTFCDWFEMVKNEIDFGNWNVIVPSSGIITKNIKPNEKEWNVGSYILGKVNRSAKASSKNYNKNLVDIGVLRGPRDLYADINCDDKNNKDFNSASNTDIKKVRTKYGLGNVPLLIIYRINQNSKARDKQKQSDSSNKRIDLNFIDDPIGVYINVPGESNSNSYAKALTVNMENQEIDTDSEIDL